MVRRALERLGSRTTRRARAGYIHSREPSVQRRWTCSTARERGSQLKPLPRQHHQSVTNDTHGTGMTAQQSLPRWLPRDTSPAPTSDSILTTLKLIFSSWAAFPPSPPTTDRRRIAHTWCCTREQGKEPLSLLPTCKPVLGCLQHPGKNDRGKLLSAKIAAKTFCAIGLGSALENPACRWVGVRAADSQQELP